MVLDDLFSGAWQGCEESRAGGQVERGISRGAIVACPCQGQFLSLRATLYMHHLESSVRLILIPVCHAIHVCLESQSNCHTPSWRLALILRCQALAYSDESACLDHTHWSCLRSPVQQARVSEPFIFTHATSLAPFWFVTSDKFQKGKIAQLSLWHASILQYLYCW